jgi:hypothetical protein
MIAEISEIWERIKRGWGRLVAWTRAHLPGGRAYRHANEQANHAEQARTTQTSIGLLAMAAQHGDDEHRIQALQTEATLVSRQVVLERNRADRGLTNEERGELASIQRSLTLLHPPASPQAYGPRPLANFGPVGVATSFLGGVPWLAFLGSPITWIAVGLAAFGVQTARITHLHHDLDGARQAARQNYRAAHDWHERSEHYRQGLIDAAEVAHLASTALTAERAAEARARAREQRRTHEIANVLAHAPEPPDWRLRDDPAAPSTPTTTTP